MFIGPHTIHTSSSVDLFVAGKGVIMFVLTTVRFLSDRPASSSIFIHIVVFVLSLSYITSLRRAALKLSFFDYTRPVGEAPDYITQAASTFMFEDLEDCCEKYYW